MITWIFLVGIGRSHSGRNLLDCARRTLAALSGPVWLAIVFIIIFPTVGAYYLNAWALTKVAPSTVAIYIYLQPLIAFGFAPLLLGETVEFADDYGCAVDLCGRCDGDQTESEPSSA